MFQLVERGGGGRVLSRDELAKALVEPKVGRVLGGQSVCGGGLGGQNVCGGAGGAECVWVGLTLQVGKDASSAPAVCVGPPRTGDAATGASPGPATGARAGPEGGAAGEEEEDVDVLTLDPELVFSSDDEDEPGQQLHYLPVIGVQVGCWSECVCVCA